MKITIFDDSHELGSLSLHETKDLIEEIKYA